MNSTSNQIVKIGFHGGQIEAVKQGDDIWISLKRMCEEFGLNADGQRVKLREKPWARTELISVPDSRGCIQEHFMVDRKSLPLWLAGIELARVAEDVREKLIRYQCEAADVLYAYFFGARKAAPVVEHWREMREQRLTRRQTAKGLERALQLADGLNAAETRIYQVRIAEVLAGEKLRELLPRTSTGNWKSPDEIGAELSVSAHRVGMLVSSIWGKERQVIPGVMESRLSKAAHNDSTIVRWFYSPQAVEQIKEHLAYPRLVEGEKVGDGAPQC